MIIGVSMRRFWCETSSEDEFVFDKEESNHIYRVLRLDKGEHIIVCDGSGYDYECILTENGDICKAEIINRKISESETKSEIALFQSVIKNEKMDIVIQKATELGITRIVPVITEYTVVKLNEKESKKQERWQRIAQMACKQCGRSRVPKVESAVNFSDALKFFREYEQRLVAYEEEKTQNICDAVKKAKSTAYFIGPEGGITENEHKQLVLQGAVSVSLGKRILRAETAAIACGSIILALTGEMDV